MSHIELLITAENTSLNNIINTLVVTLLRVTWLFEFKGNMILVAKELITYFHGRKDIYRRGRVGKNR